MTDRSRPPRPPDHDGRGLVNLVAEFEHRLSGGSRSPRLAEELRTRVPEADSVILVLFDGLGARQLDHPAAAALRTASVGHLDAPFPTTTTVSLATIATGVPPSRHGLLAYALSIPELGTVINTIHMRTVWGQDVDIDHGRFLPGPSLWQRLAVAGVEPVTVQPGGFMDSPLSTALYAGARFEPYFTLEEAVAATVDVASHPRRFVFLYVPFVDLAAHMHGQASAEYTEAMGVANAIWDRLVTAVPASVTLVGTADHGHVDIPAHRRIRLDEADERGLLLAGDARALYVTGDPTPILDRVPSRWVGLADLDGFWGGAVEDRFRSRLPDGVVFPDDGWAVLTRYMNDRLIGHHGGLSPAEREIPLLVRR